MKKLNFFTSASLFICLLFINISIAQTTIYTQTFTGSLPAGWVKTDLSGTGAGNWQYTTGKPLNWTNNGFPGPRPIMTTSSTGYMLFDSNGQNGGTNDSKAEKADLTSPAINLLGYNSINLKFEDYYWHVYSDTISVWVSTDGTNFTNVWTCNNDTCDGDFNTGRGDTINIDISSIADNQSTVYIKFRWIGNYDLFWAIDDIKITGNLIAGINNILSEKEISSYPNPVKDKLTLNMGNNLSAGNNAMIEIFDAKGQSVKRYSQEFSGKTFNLDVSDLTAGIYCLKVTGSNFYSTKKIIKE